MGLRGLCRFGARMVAALVEAGKLCVVGIGTVAVAEVVYFPLAEM